MIDAIDISSAQGVVDFDAVYESGVRLIIVKATGGQGHVNPRFEESWQALLERPHIARGSYHLAKINSDVDDPLDAEKEALDYCATMKRVGGFMDGCTCPWLDIEWAGTTLDPEFNIAWVHRWLEVVEAELGRSFGDYSGHHHWKARMGDTAKFVDYPLWQVDINRPAGNPHDMGPPWPWSIHQYSHTGTVPGIREDINVDLNVVRDEATLERLLSMRIIGEPEPIVRLAVDQVLDLASLDSSTRVEAVARLQGLLMANGLGPGGLVDGRGLPDGKAGPRTQEHFDSYRAGLGKPASTVVEGADWWSLRAVLPR